MIKDIIKESISVKEKLLQDENLIQKIEDICELMVQSMKKGGKVMICGNGGSAADAQHIAAELSGRFYLDRAALPVEALHVNTSYLTAIGNDYHFNDIYSRLVDGIGKEGDVLIGLSTSGNSPNVVKALDAARKKKISTIAFTGNSGGQSKDLADILINIPSNITPRIQESHILVGHIICEIVEARYFNG